MKEMDNTEKLRYQQQIQQLNQSKMTNELKCKTEPKILEGLLHRLTAQNDRLEKQLDNIEGLKLRLIGPSPTEIEDQGTMDDPVTVLDQLNQELSRQQKYLREIDLNLDHLDKLV